MADRSVVVRLAVEANQFKSDMASAGQSAAQAASRVETSWNKPRSTFGQTAKVIDQNKQAISDVGQSAVVAGGSMVGLTALTYKSGVEFNNLKQISNAAMKTLTGSTSAANAQMQKLNDYGSTSWLMRDSLLRAQQQMVGFGIETEKVIPYMDGLAEAVAATGGSSQQFEELAFVMSKVESRGKLTANTFNEFGMRGVDAAKIIGEQMGKTAEEIRSGVTSGSLDATETLDALAEGMKEKYNGASDNVRDTFRGAMDNVSAGWRDLSAELASPIVDPTGGGLGVDGLNILADGMYKAKDAAEELPAPVKISAAAVGILGGGATAAAGGFLIMAPRILDTIESVQQLKTVLPRTSSAVSKVGKAAGVAAAAFTVLAAASAVANHFSETTKSANEMSNALRQMSDDTGITQEKLDEFLSVMGSGGGEVTGFGYALESLDMNGFMKTMDWVGGGFGFLDSDVKLAKESMALFDETMTGLATSGNWDELNEAFTAARDSADNYGFSAEDIIDRTPDLKNALIDQAEALGLPTDNATLVSIALGDIPEAAQDAADGIAGVGDEAEDTAESVSELIDQFNILSGVFIGSEQAQIDYEQRMADINESIKENGRTLDNTTQKGRDNRTELLGLADDGWALIKANGELGKSQETLEGNFQTMYDDLVDVGKRMGMEKEEAKDYARELLGIPDDVPTDVFIEEAAKAISEASDIDAAVQDIKDKTVNVDIVYNNEGDIPAPAQRVPGGSKSSGSIASPKQKKPKYHGGIDMHGMAQGGVMEMAQFVKPGDIRFAGDRNDVDEAWIPLDGSKRSTSILQEAIERMPGFATGMAKGGITSAERRRERERKAAEAKRDREEKARERKRRQEEAKRELERKQEEARRRREHINDLRRDTRRDLRRGSIRDQVTGSRSGAYSAVDNLAKYGQDDNLSRGSRNTATRSARSFESSLRKLYNQADKLDKKLEKAKDKAQELQGINDSVVSKLSGEKNLDASKSVVSTGDGNFQQVSALSSMSGKTARLKELVRKLGKLAKMGIPGALLQEVASQGIEAGNTAADALLTAPLGERNEFVSSWAEFDKFAGQAGQVVTEGFYKGGLNAADGVVKGIEGKQKDVEKSIARMAKAMENTFRSVLGIHSPSSVMRDAAFWVPEAARLQILDSIPGIEDAVSKMGSAMVPGDSSVSVDAGSAPVADDDRGEASNHLSDMSGNTLDSMSMMSDSVAEGWQAMLLSTQEAQAAMAEATINNWAMQQETQGVALDAMTEKLLTSLESQRTGQSTAYDAMAEKLTTSLESQRVVHLTAHDSMTAHQQSSLSQQLKQLQDGFDGQHRSMSSILSDMSAVLTTRWETMSKTQSTELSGMHRNANTGFTAIRDTGADLMAQLAQAVGKEMGKVSPHTDSAMSDTAGVLNKFGAAANKAFGDLGVKVPTMKFAQGGTMPGWTPGRDVHKFSSPTAGNLEVSGGESWMIPEFTQAVGGEAGVHHLNKLAKQGKLGANLDVPQHFAQGGVWRNLWAINKSEFPGSRLTSSVRNTRTVSGNPSLHNAGKAIDVTGPRPMDMPYMAKMFNFWANNYGGNLAELIHSPAGGRQIKNGHNYLYGGAVRAQHFNHVHIAAHKMLSEMMAGQGALKGMDGFAPSHPFLDRAGVKPGMKLGADYKKAAEKITGDLQGKFSKQLPDNLFGEGLGTGIMKQLSGGLTKEAEKYGKEQEFVNPGGTGVERWRDTVIQALKRVGLPTTPDYVNAWLRQIGSESGGNPNIRQGVHDVNSGGNEAQGLVQVIPGTFRAFRDKTLPNDRNHPLANLVAGMNWAKYKYPNMLSVIGHGHGYEDGTSKARRGFNTVGENGWEVVGKNGPETRWFDGGETVLPHNEAKRALNAGSLVQGSGRSGQSQQALVDAIAASQVTGEDFARALNNTEMALLINGQEVRGIIRAETGSIIREAERAY